MPRVKQVSPNLTEKEAELVEKVVARELGRVGHDGYEIVEHDPFDGVPPSVRRRLIDRLWNAHAKLKLELGIRPAIATDDESFRNLK